MITLPDIFVPRVQYIRPVRLRRISLRPTGRIGTRTQFFQDRISIPQSQSKRTEIRQNITRQKHNNTTRITRRDECINQRL